ncbi:MAG: DUF1461 domain-containing protein [Chloroflexi bacterium]|nr:DUF1461 domain-containing protein [Chloroflexota bacterium]
MRWFIALAVPFLLVMASLRLLLSYEFLRIEYVRPGFPADDYGFTTADRLQYGMHAIGFLFSAAGVEDLARIRLPEDKCWQPAGGAPDCALFNARELIHLEDVKSILGSSFSLAIIWLFSAILCLLVTANGQLAVIYRTEILTGLRRGAHLTLAMILALTVLAAAIWNRAFDAFHELFFATSTWRFPFSDSLIRLYPEQLFVDAAFAIAVFSAASALLILGALRLWERR